MTTLPDHIKKLIRPNILTLEPYRCARDDYDSGILLDANENAYGPPLVQHDDNELPNDTLKEFQLERYPDPYQMKLKTILSDIRGTKPEQIAVGNGSDELIDLLMRIFCQPSSSDHILTCPPTYGMYKTTATVNDVPLLEVPLTAEYQLDVPSILQAVTPNTKLMFLCSPGNPTACLLNKEDILTILRAPEYEGMIIVDEAYIDFALTAACGRAVSGGCREVGLGARALGLMYKVNDNNNETGNDLKYTARLRTHQQLILPSPSSLGSAVLF